MPSILNTQMQIVAEFEELESWEDRYKRIIQIGRELPSLPPEDQQDEHKVRGCSSTVWLLASLKDGRVHYRADSDAVIVRGLVALLLRVYNGHSPQEILAAEPAFIEELGLNTHLSSNRANGLSAMVKQIKTYALAYTKNAPS
ncbi:MAG: SufE family protein [Planctomycetota bacterium]|nr:MAG: SufE family protein [Planctomycetota bacterium]